MNQRHLTVAVRSPSTLGRGFKSLHMVLISLALATHVAVNYAVFIPGVLDPFVDFVFSRFRALLDMNLLIVVVYARLMFRLKGGSTALAVTSVALLPLLINPGPDGDGLSGGFSRDQAIEVGLVLLMGALVVTVQEFLSGEREGRERLGQQLENTSRQLTALNRMAQQDLNAIFVDFKESVDEELRQLDSVTLDQAQLNFTLFLHKVLDILDSNLPRKVGGGSEIDRDLGEMEALAVDDRERGSPVGIAN